MVVNLEGESRTIRNKGPTFGHKRTLGNICAQKFKALEKRLQGSFNEILAKKGERAHLAPLGKLEVTDGKVHRGPEKDLNTRSE